MSMREQKARDYLKVIDMLAVYGPVRAAYVAREMRLTRPTVCVAVRKLTEDGYITQDQEHLLHLTPAGRKLIRESVNEAAQDGNGQAGVLRAEDGEAKAENSLTPEQAIRRLEKEHAAALPEAVLILSGRYYAVRTIDVAQYLGCSSATVRAKLRRLESSGYVALGDESIVRLTPFGTRIAEQLYARRAPERERLMRQGRTIQEAEREALAEGI